jgi:hypothetical protein
MIKELRDREWVAKQQSLSKAENENEAVKGEWWAPAAQLKSTVVCHLSGFMWFEPGCWEKPGHFCRWG